MMVYGDRREIVEPELRLAELRRLADSTWRCSMASIDDQAQNAQVVVDAGALAQGLLDRAFRQRGYDEAGALSLRVNRLLLAAGQFFVHGGKKDGLPAKRRGLLTAIDSLMRLRPRGPLEIRLAEGHAYYCVYPELYECAARAYTAGAPFARLLVIGIRTIGAGLAGVVAAGAAARYGLVTVRPVGHPFRRRLAVGPYLHRYLMALPPDTHFALVDEGPGASGSSLGAVIDWLGQQGVEAFRIHLFPSHAGAPGPRAAAHHRAAWARIDRHVSDFESWFDGHLQARTLGSGYRPMAPGSWRSALGIPADLWPPSFLQQERRKYLSAGAAPGSEARLARFVGLGRHGLRAAQIAYWLASKGLGPSVHGLHHGFLVMTWCRGARPLCGTYDHDRLSLLDVVARYLVCRTNDLGMGRDGTRATALLDMAMVNASERFGSELASPLRKLQSVAARLSDGSLRILSDNRMHAWEWLLCPDGTIYKVDAIDHHAAHDCIGCQDLGWDVAGAIIELELRPDEGNWLAGRLAACTQYRPNRLRDAFYAATYLAFQLGYYTEAAAANGFDSEESTRCRHAADRYAGKLQAVLAELS